MEVKRIINKAHAFRFPDSGPEQEMLTRKIEEQFDVKIGLYDGWVEHDVETSTGANWRWSTASCGNDWANIGDWIVIYPNSEVVVYSDDDFKKLFKESDNSNK